MGLCFDRSFLSRVNAYLEEREGEGEIRIKKGVEKGRIPILRRDER